jgi:hypothetical protein
MVETISNSGSSLVNANGTNGTFTALSTNLILSVGSTPVGAVQTVQITESRTIKQIDELGYDGHVDSAPSASSNVRGTLERIRYDGMRLATAMGRDFIHIKSQRYPFNLTIIDQWNGNALNPTDNSASIITTIQNIWFEEISYNYTVSDWIIVDRASFVAETIYSTLGASNPASFGGIRSIPLSTNSPTGTIEIAADTGQLRGAMSSPGLISAFLPF